MSKYLLFLFLFLMPFYWLHWFQSFFFINRSPSFSFFFFFLLGAPHFLLVFGVVLFLFFFFPFSRGPCVDSCLSSFSFLFSAGLVSTIVFLFFFFLPFPAWGAAYFLLVFGVEFFFLFPFFWGSCVFSLSFQRLNKPFEIDPYVSWPPLWFTSTQYIIMPWTTCFGLRHQICFMLHSQIYGCVK